MHLHAADRDVRHPRRLLINLGHAIQGDAELVFAAPGRDVAMCSGIDVGINAQARSGACTPLLRAIRSMQASSASLSTLKLKTPWSSAYSISSCDLPTPAKVHFRGSPPAASTRKSSPPETMSNPAPSRDKQFEDGAIRVRFDRVADQVVDLAERRVEPAVVIENRAGAVDVERRSIFLRDAFQIHVFAMESAVVVMKRVHASGCVGAEMAQTGNVSSRAAQTREVTPQPEIALTHDVTTLQMTRRMIAERRAPAGRALLPWSRSRSCAARDDAHVFEP